MLIYEDDPGTPENGLDLFHEVIRNRSVPGILVFDMTGRSIYLNREAKEILVGDSETPGSEVSIPEEIRLLCEGAIENNPGNQEDCPCAPLFIKEERYAIRAMPLYEASSNSDPVFQLISLERCSLGRKLKVDVELIRRKFYLTKRETELVQEVAKGCTNQEIASSLSISEHTVKEYLRNVMKKLSVTNRSSIICKILE